LACGYRTANDALHAFARRAFVWNNASEPAVKRELDSQRTDGNRLCINAMENAFQGNVDYVQLVKIYGTPDDERQPR
jgi:hypothetical protein